jgi:hypothetical protein
MLKNIIIVYSTSQFEVYFNENLLIVNIQNICINFYYYDYNKTEIDILINLSIINN